MNEGYMEAFLSSVENVLLQFGVSDIKKTSKVVKEELVIDKDVTAFVGIVGDIRGNVAYAFSGETAKKIASTMMMGFPVETLDEMARSTIAELSNMFTGNAASILAEKQIKADITTPSVVVGEDMFFILNFVQTTEVSLETSLGVIEVNLSLEL